MQDIEATIKHVEQSCKHRGKQLTTKRKIVLRALIHSNKALSAYELVDYCKEHFDANIQAMTIYRVLDFLESEQLAHKIKVSNKYVACSHIHCEHDHGVAQFLICSKCNKISEQTIDPEMVSGLQSNARQEGFTVINPQLEISCVCDECAKKESDG
ncbi:transcriptional repressor [Vibrio europaeus]|uniref:Fur family transcriptional regulator n=1 Tax=Vibrio europaeus TaxID=300876 RepID=A0A178J732_9VIBR|nr:transcriptional repressor [Vibrio europaeus]MDC5705805.1 transcriptional repressor [Vibrio europaeus]MDC5709215.1 transcriptional repressor [Vibrio europaeus]MDC5713614.1 transcriptional repressor [Vibrio europaeus]MDC5720334.1 transcriptional repressor [Vibrio europaeus]MDC5723779.1 transcriptional repressor [Vibrio europaeus]